MYFANVDLDKIDYVVDNLSDESREELQVLYGDDYEMYAKAEVYNFATNYDIRTLCFDNGIPCLTFGLFPYNESLNIFLLTTKDYKKVSSTFIIKQSIKQVNLWMMKYKKDLYDQVYYKNTSVIKWLRLLGFKEVDNIGEFILMKKTYREVKNVR